MKQELADRAGAVGTSRRLARIQSSQYASLLRVNEQVMFIANGKIIGTTSGRPDGSFKAPRSKPIRGMPNLNGSLVVARLRYSQSVHEPPDLQNPDTLVKYFIPLLDRWRCRWTSVGLRVNQYPFYYYLLARTKYYDQVFVNATYCGVQQIINIGSGTDTRAYRFSHVLKSKGIRVVECDQAEAIRAKQRLAKRLGHFDHVEYLPLDLNDDGWPELERRLAATQAKSLVLMEGVSPYVSESSFSRFLAFLADRLSADSRIAYDFKICDADDDFCRTKALFRLPSASDKIASFHARHRYRLEHIELSAELSTRLLPNLVDLGTTLYCEDGLVQLKAGT